MFFMSFFKKIFNFDRLGYITKMSEEGREFLKNIEGLRLKPYDDQNGAPLYAWNKNATIGYGHLIQTYEWRSFKDGIDKNKANSLFNKDLKIYEKAVNEEVGKVPANKHEFDALVLFCYNIGINGFKRSSVIKIIKGEDTNYENLEQAWLAWNKSDGKVNQGLINRREAEFNIYSLGKYDLW